MGNIVVLPEQISNKIAAGEVVERPASVVKELVENAIDANAKKIEIEFKDGGQSYIKVADDGCGMSSEDARLCLQRHATSKIKTDKDLFAIKTLGFRGEALPSIAAVSQMKLTTRTKDSDAGTFINLEGGQIKENSPVGAASGTVIEITNIFFNTPARRKFLKTKLTEAGHITDIVTKLALVQPQIYFSLKHGRQQILLLPCVKTIDERITAIWEQKFFKKLIPVEGKSSFINISGFVAKPEMSRATRAGQYIFINNRPIRNLSISHALSLGFQGMLTKGRFPVAFLFLKIDPTTVDVNVHPAKTEVKFSKQNAVHDYIANLVKEGLGKSSLIPSVSLSEKIDLLVPETIPKKQTGTSNIQEPDTQQQKRVKAAIGQFLDKHQLAGEIEQKYLFSRSKDIKVHKGSKPSEKENLKLKQKFESQENKFTPLKSESKPIKSSDQTDAGNLFPNQPENILPEILHVFGQLDNSYILCQTKEGLLIIDQHAAHERVLYERLTAGSAKISSQQQALLMPITLELTQQEAMYLEDNLTLWKDLGFDIEEFGPDTFIIRSIPLVTKETNLVELVRDIIDQLQQDDAPPKGPGLKDKLITMMACKMAIKAGDKLESDEIVSLLKQMTDPGRPYTCPHGRPAMIKLSLSELARKFHRT